MFKSLIRKRGVSIENVMLGLVVVLIFGGLLYGAFSVLNLKNQARHWQGISVQASLAIKEHYGIHGRQPSFMKFAQSGPAGIMATSKYLYESGAIPDPIFGATNYVPVLPNGGLIQARVNHEYSGGPDGIQGFDNFVMTFQFGDNSRQSKRLCGAIAGGGSGLINSIDEMDNPTYNPERAKEVMIESGPLGSNYTILTNACNGEMFGVPVLQVSYYVN